MTRRKAKRWSATDAAKARPKSKGNVGPPWCKLCESSHWARDGHRFDELQRAVAELPPVKCAKRPIETSRELADNVTRKPGSSRRSRARAAAVPRTRPARRRDGILEDNIKAINAGTELTDKGKPITQAERQAKWRRDHPEAHREQQRQYKARRRLRERAAARLDNQVDVDQGDPDHDH